MVKSLPAHPSTDLISTQLSTKELTFQPGGAPASFEVTVTNNSDQFATFQVEVLAAGTDSTVNHRWYTLSPEVCTKKPPGDSTRFAVQIFNTPRPGYVGLIKLTVRVFSLELREADSRQVLNLIVQGSGLTPPQLDLVTQTFTGYPGDRIKIPFSLQSHNRRITNISLQLSGLDASWFPEGTERRLQLAPNELIKDAFECHIPALTHAPSRTYTVTLEASQPQTAPAKALGTLTVLPQGFVTFACTPTSQQLPTKSTQSAPQSVNETAQPTSRRDRTVSAHYTLQLENHSNLEQPAKIEASFWQTAPSRLRVPAWFTAWKRNRNQVRYQDLLKRSLEITPETANLTLTAPTEFQLTVHQPRPWLGWTRKRWIQVKAQLTDQRVDVRNDTQLLELRILPRLPFWLQLGSAAVVLLLGGAILWKLLHEGHTAPVNTLRFSGLASDVVSGADDQTIRRWRVEGNRLVSLGILEQSNKAVRVVRYRPVNNDAVAIGFENGEIQLVNLLTGVSLPAFADQKDDRVFDLAFTRDSQTLFSGHGSGRVIQWSLDATGKATKARDRLIGFAISSLALVGDNQRYLAIGGRFNQLVLWDLQTNQIHQANQGTGSERDYILSLATPTQKPDRLATADNQGTIKLWDLRPCLNGNAPCKAVDEWTPDKTIHAVAFSADGCYVASAGESGHALLWPLTERGDRRSQTQSGQEVGRSKRRLTAIDVARTKDTVFVSAGGDDANVRLRSVKADNPCR